MAYLKLLLLPVLLLSTAVAVAKSSTEQLEGRDAIVYVPTTLASSDRRALVVVLHGGLGNAENIVSGRAESPLNLNSLADQRGFVVAYLNGTPVTRFLGSDKLGWNAGNCCGQPALKSVDDVSYISRAVTQLTKRYAIDPKRVFGIGHSNGAMMTQRMICETEVYAAGVAISGPLMTEGGKCPGAHGKHVLAIHGADDKNVPVGGGRGEKGLSRALFVSEHQSLETLTHAGSTYDLQIVAKADHFLPNIDQALRKSEGQSIGEKALRFFNLLGPKN